MATEIEQGIDEAGQPIRYRLNKMPVRVQFQVARRLAPVVLNMKGMLAASAGSGDGALARLSVDFIEALEPLVQAIGSLSDETCDYVLDACLSAAQRNQGPAWTPVYNASKRVMMFDDIDMPGMLQLAAAVLQENLGSFFPAPPSVLNPPPAT